MPLIEREQALKVLDDCLVDVADGRGRLVLVSGEAGVGKSALVEEFARTRQPLRWFAGACDTLSTPRPLGVLFDIAVEVRGELLTECINGASRERLFARLLDELAVEAGRSALWIDDVHWADESTLDLILFLMRRLRTLPLLLVVTCREEEPPRHAALARFLERLAADPQARRIRLRPLSFEAVRTLVTGTEFDAMDVYELTNGNPFFVTEVLSGTPGTIPPSTCDVVLARAATLSPSAQRVVRAAALLGPHIRLELLRRVEPDCGDALDEIVAHGILLSGSDPLRFRHEITRLAVLDGLGLHRRRALHARCLEALISMGHSDLAELAHHAEGADDHKKVLDYSVSAGDLAAKLGAHRQAATQYTRALKYCPPAQQSMRAGLLDRLADACGLFDQGEKAAFASDEAALLWGQLGDRRRQGASLLRLSRALYRLCRGEDAGEVAHAAVALLEPLGPSAELAAAWATLATQHMLLGRLPQALDVASRALDAAQDLGLPAIASAALNTRACARALAGEPDWCLDLRSALAVAIDDDDHESASRAFANLAELHILEFNLGQAERFVSEGLAFADEHGLDNLELSLRGKQVAITAIRGHHDEAVKLARPLLEPGRTSRLNRFTPLLYAGLVLCRIGDPEGETMLHEVAELAQESGESLRRGLAHLALVEAHWLAGRTEQAVLDLAAAAQAVPDRPTWLSGTIATWQRRLGLFIDRVGPFPPAIAAELKGDVSLARRLWSEAGAPYEAARALAGSTEQAHLREAHRAFEVLRAGAAAGVVRRELRARGHRVGRTGPRSTVGSRPFGLTERQFEVWTLLVEGRTNTAIAERLSLSRKTVDHHVSAVLRKLGVPNRAGAAELVRSSSGG